MGRIFLLPGGRNDDVNNMIRLAQEGHDQVREDLITTHQLFIKKIVLKNVTGFEVIDNRDEYSIGLIAFNEAIDAYKPGFRSFRAFAAEVIKRRLIDYQRFQSKHKNQTVYLEEVAESTVEELKSTPMDQMDIKLEMETFVEKLAQHGIMLNDLINGSPKHSDSRLRCIKIAQLIINEPELKNHFLKYKSLPLKIIVKNMNVNSKTVERHRKYIIAICLILLGDSDILKDYVIQFGKGGEIDA